MLLLIQFDVCTPLMDAISYQLEIVENTMAEPSEDQASDEVYYRTSQNLLTQSKCLTENLLTLFKNLFIPTIIIQVETPVPKILGKTIQQHIIYCVYRI